MAKRILPSVAADFASVIAYFQNRGLIPEKPPEAMIENAKRIHRATYSLILWKFRLTKLPEHGRVFMEEIASDAIQILPQVLGGFGKTAKLLTRGVLENTLRHMYFLDHPIEYGRMNRDKKWYMSVTDLLQYAFAHPVTLETEKKFDAINKISRLYGDLSASVHGRTVQHLEMRAALEDLRYNNAAATADARVIEQCTEPANFVLAALHKTSMGGFQKEDRSIILRTISPRGRNALAKL